MREPFFPQEVISNVPRITLTGTERLQVEQHKGLIAYQPEEVIFRVSTGKLTVTGQELRFSRYTATEAVLIGVIDAVETGGGA